MYEYHEMRWLWRDGEKSPVLQFREVWKDEDEYLEYGKWQDVPLEDERKMVI